MVMFVAVLDDWKKSGVLVLVFAIVHTGLLLNAVPKGIVQATGAPVPTVT